MTMEEKLEQAQGRTRKRGRKSTMIHSSSFAKYSPGTIVSTRDREWIVLPSSYPDLLELRPLSGSEREATAIYVPLGLGKISPATFPLPDIEKPGGDFASAMLLWDAVRLSLRSGAGPFRSMGRISVRPRPYQFVPLIMALRLNPVRMLIADDVGVGKTIEAGLIARELLDRGEIRRLAVLAPPYLCDQWRKELAEKFNINAVIIGSGTVARLEREMPRRDISVFRYYPYMVVSIDFAKSPRRRAVFETDCPKFVIVDEAHGASRPAGRSKSQQQRYELVSRIASKVDRHLLLLTATPHSGVEESFKSLLGLLNPNFERWDFQHLSANKRRKLAMHFVQRRRKDVEEWLGTETPFPQRISSEETYELDPMYRKLFDEVYTFAREIVRSGETMTGFQRRIRYWTALSLLRSLMSSPASARAALEARAKRIEEEIEESEGADKSLFEPYVLDATGGEGSVDVTPSFVVEEGAQRLKASERRKLREFAKKATDICGNRDTKIEKAARVVDGLLEEGYHPIVWCRYIDTSDYVAKELRKRLSPKWSDVRIISITGLFPEEERRLRVEEISKSPRRVLVSTDCLSEGINLQDAFNAVVHYDLPWNPNRLEQREGRVDRFGQRSPTVKAVLLYGQDNPVDGAVLKVLIRKAVGIHRDLGIYVPVPMDSETVMEAVLRSLFLHGEQADYQQLSLFPDERETTVGLVHKQWDEAVQREKKSRTLFAQHAIKPAEVAREIEETDAVLGDPEAVERFVTTACQRLNSPLQKTNEGWKLYLSSLPILLKEYLESEKTRDLFISFKSPAPQGYTYVGRNHPLTTLLAEYLIGEALDTAESSPPASRTGVIRTDAVSKRTTLFLLRQRYLLRVANKGDTLAEEAIVWGFEGRPGKMLILEEMKALELLRKAHPAANVSDRERGEWLGEALGWIKELSPRLTDLTRERANRLLQAHKRVRKLTKEEMVTVQPQLPPDVLGVYVLLPIVKGR